MTVHVATSADIGKVVARALGVPVSFVSDNLLVGPCAADFDAHRALRLDVWDQGARARVRLSRAFDGLAAALGARGRLVVWTSALWSDRVALWALCAFRLDRRPSRLEILVARLGPETAGAFGCGSVRVAPAEARRTAEDLRPLSLTSARTSAAAWRKLAGHRPVLAGAVREGLVDVGTYQAGFFPRHRGGALLVSRFDELLLSCLGDGWSTPVDVFVHRSAQGEELRRWLGHTGDVFLAMRLRQWAEHGGASAALESAPGRSGDFMSARYRLSEAGREIAERGLGVIAWGAPLAVWGAVAYSPPAPWAVVDDARGRPVLRIVGSD